MTGKWTADAGAKFSRRWGRSPHELGTTGGNVSCPDIWEGENGDIAVIGTMLTDAYLGRLPEGVSIDPGELQPFPDVQAQQLRRMLESHLA